MSELEKLMGPTLLTKVGSEKPTKNLLKGKDLVALYFSASWCSPCQAFTPTLMKFYNTCASGGNLEIVYVSSDRDLPSFHEYYGKMPWLAIPANKEATAIKTNLAQSLQIRGIPTLVILDVKTGHFITDNGRNAVSAVSGDKVKGMELVASWKAAEPVPFDQAEFGAGEKRGWFGTIVFFLLKNPMYFIGIYYIVRKILKMLQEAGAEDGLEDGDVGSTDSDAGTGEF